jgi:hypothetical protein
MFTYIPEVLKAIMFTVINIYVYFKMRLFLHQEYNFIWIFKPTGETDKPDLP